MLPSKGSIGVPLMVNIGTPPKSGRMRHAGPAVLNVVESERCQYHTSPMITCRIPLGRSDGS